MASEYTCYKVDQTGHQLKADDIVRIVKSTKTTMAYKKFDWEVVSTNGYNSKIRPAKSAGVAGAGIGEQNWDNSRLVWKSTPALVGEKVGSGKFKIGDKLTVTNSASWDKDYEGLPVEVIGEFSAASVKVKPLAPRPNAGNSYEWTSFMIEEQYLVSTTTYVNPTLAKKLKSGFSVCDKVTLVNVEPIIAHYEGIECEVIGEASNGNVHLKSLVKKTGILNEFYMEPKHVVLTNASDAFTPAVEAKTPEVGNFVKITKALGSYMSGYVGFVAKVIKVSSDKKTVKLQPMSPRPDGDGMYDFWYETQGVEVTIEPEAEFPKGTIVKINHPGSKYHDLPGIVIYDPMLSFDDEVQLRPLRDRPTSSENKRLPFWYSTSKLLPFENSKDLKVGDRVRILGAASGTHPKGSVGTIKEKKSHGGWTVTFASGIWDHSHSPSQLELTDDPLTKDNSLEPFVESVKSEFKIGSKVKIISNGSSKHPTGSIGTIKEKSPYEDEWVVTFKGSSVEHWHPDSELELVDETPAELKVGDFVEILASPSVMYPIGSIGKIEKIVPISSSAMSYSVQFKDQIYPTHTHGKDELKFTTEPWDDKVSAKAKAAAKKTGKPEVLASATVTMSTEDQNKLKALEKIAKLMKDKKMSPVIRTETIAQYLDEVGMLK